MRKYDLKMTSPCGINCETYPAYQVSISGDSEEKKKISKTSHAVSLGKTAKFNLRN